MSLLINSGLDLFNPFDWDKDFYKFKRRRYSDIVDCYKCHKSK